MSESASIPSWVEAASAALAVILSVISMYMSVRTDKRARVSRRQFLNQKNLQEMVDRIETIDKSALSSPESDMNELALIVAKKMQEYEAVFAVYKQYLPEAVRQKLNDNLTSIKNLGDAAVNAAKIKSADLNKLRSEYFNAMANFVIDFKRESHASLEQASLEIARSA